MSRGAYAVHPPGLHEALVVPTPDIVCVGSRGQKLLKRLVLGSVSTATLASSNVPVCVYRADLPAPSPESVQTRFKLGDEQQSSRAVCIALSGSDASHTVVGWSLATLLRPSDRVVLLLRREGAPARSERGARHRQPARVRGDGARLDG